MQPAGPVLVAHLFPEERQELLALLAGLPPASWDLPTVCAGWSVKDLAAHIAGDDLNNLSGGRDGYVPSRFSASGWAELVAWINARNEAWVAALRRLSPRVLLELLQFSGERTFAHFAALDPFAPGMPVSWAGPEPAPTWLHVARELTERWLHQQQIRDAVGAPALYTPRLFAPVLDTFARALPHTYRDVAATEGTVVELTISGEAGGTWLLRRVAHAWELWRGVADNSAAAVVIDQTTAWRLLTKGIEPAAARAAAAVRGDIRLAAPIFQAVAIIA